MAVAWPAINTAQFYPLSKIPLDQRTMFATDAGGPKVYSLSTNQIFVVNFDVVQTAAENDTFWVWWASTANNGSEDFTGLEDVHTTTQRTYRFMTPPQFSRWGLLYLRAPLSLWQIA